MTTGLNPELWTLVRVAFHVGFFLSAAYLLNRMLDARKEIGMSHLPRPRWSLWLPVGGLAALFVAILVHQASWQLAGAARPKFLAFMQLHDRRELNPAHRLRRGRILDRRGEVLAYSEEVGGRVRRVYPDGAALAHVIGYSDSMFGTAGIEAVATVELSGGAPIGLEQWGNLGREILVRDRAPRGQDVRVSIDRRLQRAAFASLRDRHGAIVVLRPSDGAVMALVSSPSYDPNEIGAAIGQRGRADAALLNRATQGLYPPGSVFKIVLAAVALETGFSGRLDTPAEGFTTSSRYPKIRDHEYYLARDRGANWRGHGILDLPRAFARSSNVFFAQLGVHIGPVALQRMAERLLFNRRLVLHQSPYGSWSMQTGSFPRLAQSDRYGLAQVSIGQGALLVTPAHMAVIAAALGNRGQAMRPRLLELSAPQPMGTFMAEDVARRLVSMMRLAVSEGTARGIETPGLRLAGKTGTAENPRGVAHSWFVGLAPAERPQLAIAVLVEHGGSGAQSAAPIARDLMMQAIKLDLIL
jgi:peptidoglycan glycosyltransferase